MDPDTLWDQVETKLTLSMSIDGLGVGEDDGL